MTLSLKGHFPKIQRFFWSQFLALFFTLKYLSQKECLCLHIEVGSKILFFICPQVCFFALSLSIKILCLLFFCVSCSKANRLPPHYCFVLLRLLRTCLFRREAWKGRPKQSIMVLQWFLAKSHKVSILHFERVFHTQKKMSRNLLRY